MKRTIAERIYRLIEDEGPKTIKALRRRLPDINPKSINMAVSHKKHLFLGLSKGRVGLVEVHNYILRREKKKENINLAIYQRIVNLLVCGPMRIERITEEMPDINSNSIEVEISNHPELFLRIKPGLIGRRGRDEYLKEKYARKSFSNSSSS